jgi:hypothetical protein
MEEKILNTLAENSVSGRWTSFDWWPLVIASRGLASTAKEPTAIIF